MSDDPFKMFREEWASVANIGDRQVRITSGDLDLGFVRIVDGKMIIHEENNGEVTRHDEVPYRGPSDPFDLLNTAIGDKRAVYLAEGRAAVGRGEVVVQAVFPTDDDGVWFAYTAGHGVETPPRGRGRPAKPSAVTKKAPSRPPREHKHRCASCPESFRTMLELSNHARAEHPQPAAEFGGGPLEKRSFDPDAVRQAAAAAV